MHRRRIALAISLIGLAIAAPLAHAGPTSHHIKLTIHSFTTSSSTSNDTPGTRQMGVGLVSGTPIGQGVSTLADKVTTASQAGIKFKGDFTIYTVNGNLSATITINVKPNATGGATGSGAGTFTGGTGRYRGAHGQFTFTGSQTASAPDFTVHLSGTAKY
jgi:hypothetical protein